MADKEKAQDAPNILEDPDIVLDDQDNEDTVEAEYKKTKAAYDKIKNSKYVDDQYDENLDIFNPEPQNKPKYKELTIKEKSPGKIKDDDPIGQAGAFGFGTRTEGLGMQEIWDRDGP